MLAGVEQALVPDGPVGTSTTAGNISRLLRYSVDGNDATPAEQYAYELEPLHQTGSGDGSSLSELVYLPDGRLIALERSDAGGEFLVRAFLTTTEGATDVSQGSFATGLAATGSGQAPGGGAGNDDPLDHSVDVTAALTAWSADPSTNYGVVFFPTGASGTGARTSEHGTADDRPELTVTYEAVPDPVTVTFQQGSGGYTGTVDTFIDLAGGPYGGSTEMSWEDDPGESPDVLEITLLRFEGIFDTNGGPVPAGATISSASIAYVTQDGGDAADVFIVTHDWDESVEYDDFGATPGAQEGEDYSGSAVDGPGYVSLSKKLLFSDDGLGKLEGLAAGPTLPSGDLVFVGVTDEFSNYSDIRSFVLSLDLAECGNGTIDAGESCDDGNEVGGDCCSAVCQVEIDGSACDDELFCTAVDTCSSGVCGGVGVTDCSASDDQCNVGVCNEGTDSCDASPNNVGNACDDGQFCTSGENCSAVGVCDDGGATDCSGAADDCNVGVCNEGTDSCDAQASNEAGGCDDAQFCTTGE
ncbi:MAG: esterase-like activity of phytase family protein, partial [Myxococcota bacterium]